MADRHPGRFGDRLVRLLLSEMKPMADRRPSLLTQLIGQSIPNMQVVPTVRTALRRYVMCRPEGQRCVVAAAGGVSFSRLRNGVQLHRFDSALPGGSSATAGGGNDAYTILDCIYQPETNTYYVMDLMAWKVCAVLVPRVAIGLPVVCSLSPCVHRMLCTRLLVRLLLLPDVQGVQYYDCSAEFRQYWLHTKLGELDNLPQQAHTLQGVPAYPCTRGVRLQLLIFKADGSKHWSLVSCMYMISLLSCTQRARCTV